ncbi:uncharacterized protein [Pocillopora verrucosa]|uniref:uncharacterized protein n=1 Tax=Pocillopora verrucosa TaxID=203993 RepID=UPI00333E9A7B
MCVRFMLLLWICSLCHNGEGFTKDLNSVLRKARCYANCLTRNGVKNESETSCLTQACKECLAPCNAKTTFPDENSCKASCNKANSCFDSCEFLTWLKNFQSLSNGDGSLLPVPGPLNVTILNFTSLSLQWSHVLNSNGTPIYLVEIMFDDEVSRLGPFYPNQVIVESKVMLTFHHLCTFTPDKNQRAEFKDINFSFRVAVLTENSSVSYGLKSNSVAFPKPDPVTNVTLDSLLYDGNHDGNKLLMTSSWKAPKGQENIVSNYALRWKQDSQCQGIFFRNGETTGPQTRYNMSLYAQLKKCTHELEVFTIIGCSVSVPAILRYTYPGCQNITRFPKDNCYKFDPPDAPMADRMVTNIRLAEPMTPAPDYRFYATFTWNPPVYPYKNITEYAFTWSKQPEHLYLNRGGGSPLSNSKTVSDLLPGTIYKVQVFPVFQDKRPWSKYSDATFTTPGIDPNEVKVTHLTAGQFTESSDGGSLSVVISWEKPIFNYSTLALYTFRYKVGNKNGKEELMPNQTYFSISGMLHGKLVRYWVTPRYQHDWVKGVQVYGNITAPELDNQEIQVQNLRVGSFLEDEESNTFSVNFTWEPPPFKFSTVHSYTVSYELYGGYSREELSCPPLQMDSRRLGCSKSGDNLTFLQISGMFPRESVTVKVTPIYSNSYITGKMAEERGTAPQPREELVQVNSLKYDEIFPTANNTFRTTVSWEKPLFIHSDVHHYSYKVVAINSLLRKRRETLSNTMITTTGTNVTISGISRVDGVEFQVTPVFFVSAVTGADAKISLAWKSQTDKNPVSDPMTTAELAGLVIGVILAVLIATGLLFWCYRERQRKLGAKGRVSGKNALMIDHWEVDGDSVTLEEELGEGAFGKVYKGVLKESTSPSRRLSIMRPKRPMRRNMLKQTEGLIVAVKMLHGMADNDQRREFLEEIQLMKAVGTHRNIVNMLGCCTVNEPMFLLVEYIPYGDLLHYLRKRRGKTTRSDCIYVNNTDAPKGDDGNIQILSFTQSAKTEERGRENTRMDQDEVHEDADDDEETLNPGDLLAFAWQISEGMEYLARKGFVHRDLAARNVLVGDNKIAKVADFGLTRHVYEEKVYHAKRNRKLPLKWMSVEAIFDQTFTAQSDVWAFGVLLWELVTLGGTPYPTVNNRELLRLLKDGYRMEKPDICNDEMYKMMRECWLENPFDRPTFTLIRERLEEMMQKDNPYLDLSVLDESQDCYNVPSFNSLVDESEDEVFDKEEGYDLLEEDHKEIINDKDQPIKDSNKNETAPSPKSSKFPGEEENDEPVDVDKIDFNNIAFQSNDLNNLKEVKVDFDALEMALYRHGGRRFVF